MSWHKVFWSLWCTLMSLTFKSTDLLQNAAHSHLDWGTVLSTKRKMAFSEGSWMRFLMIHMNWATVMSEGTRYFLLSMSTICDPDTFSTITWTQRHTHFIISELADLQKQPPTRRRAHSPGRGQGTCCGFWLTLCIDVLQETKTHAG